MENLTMQKYGKKLILDQTTDHYLLVLIIMKYTVLHRKVCKVSLNPSFQLINLMSCNV